MKKIIGIIAVVIVIAGAAWVWSMKKQGPPQTAQTTLTVSASEVVIDFKKCQKVSQGVTMDGPLGSPDPVTFSVEGRQGNNCILSLGGTFAPAIQGMPQQSGVLCTVPASIGTVHLPIVDKAAVSFNALEGYCVPDPNWSTANTYTNTEYGFEIKYPKDYDFVATRVDTSAGQSSLANIWFAKKPHDDLGPVEFSVEIQKSSMAQELSSLKKEKNFKNVKSKTIKVGQNNFTLATWTHPALPGAVDTEEAQEALIQHNNLLYIIAMPSQRYSTVDEATRLLSTFKFTK
jgi:hypothetical protein